MNWAKERDLLVAQTVAFVQSVTGSGKKPAVETRAEARSILPACTGREKADSVAEIALIHLTVRNRSNHSTVRTVESIRC